MTSTDLLQPASQFDRLPDRFREWIQQSPDASKRFQAFFADKGVIRPEIGVVSASYEFERADQPLSIVVDAAQWGELGKVASPGSTQQATPDYAYAHMFGQLAHEIGHDRYNTRTIVFEGSTPEEYVRHRSEIEARAIFSTFSIFKDLEGRPDFDTDDAFKGIGYLKSSELAGMYDQWRRGTLDETTAVQQIASKVADAPYSRGESLQDQDGNGSLTHRDFYLHGYKQYIEPTREPTPGQAIPAEPADAKHPDNAMFEKLRCSVAALDAQSGKAWDPHSDRLCASVYMLAKGKGFTGADELRVGFNNPTERLAAGELVHLYRVGAHASPDPFANRAHMSTADALSMPVEDRYRQAETVGQTKVEAAQLAAQQVETRANQAVQAGPTFKA